MGNGLRMAAAGIGIGTFLGCGFVLGTWWWIPAAVGAAASAGAWLDPRTSHLAVLAGLGVVAGAIDADATALVVVVTVGFVVSLELYAVADRLSVVRPAVPVLSPVAGAGVVAAAVTSAVLIVGEVSWTRPIGAAVVAALAGALALRVLVR